MASGILNGQTGAFAVEEEITEPLEGQEFEDDEDVTIQVHGEPDSDYTLLICKVGTTNCFPVNITTDIEGEATHILDDSVTSPGDYIIQLREGHNNTSGTTLDSVGFTVLESPE